MESGGFSFVDAVLIANSPQLLLSFCYLAYNNLFTRLQMAKEWALMSTAYRPLRVTDPKGDQISTYRLQLPYKYSIPLIMLSIFLHWLLSNTLYTFVSEGSYFLNVDTSVDNVLPSDSAAVVGYSSWSLLVLLAVSAVLIWVPLGFGYLRLPGHMVTVGSNSLALSAACHGREQARSPQFPGHLPVICAASKCSH
jgi:hypothetical protein